MIVSGLKMIMADNFCERKKEVTRSLTKTCVKRLLEEVRILEQSSENKRRKEMWQEIPASARDQWRGVPKNDHSWKNGAIPLTIDLQNSFWAKYFNFSLVEYYSDAEVFLENYLKITVERFKMFADDTYIVKRIPIWAGSGFEGSMFGMRVHSYPDKDPWLDNDIMIKTQDDLNKLSFPDFHTSGIMPVQIKLYEELKDIIAADDTDFEVLFPEWLRGPFGLALYLRGFENMLVDMMLDPEFAQALLAFITAARENWYRDLAQYLGKPIQKGNLFNDEINCPTVSRQLYSELILPFEQEICKFHGGLLYWHSCGDVTKILEEISEIPEIDMMHIGPWTNIDKAIKIFKNRMPLEINVNWQRDVLDMNEEQMRSKIMSIICDCINNDAGGFEIRLSGVSLHHSLEETIARARMWNKAASDVIRIEKDCSSWRK